MITAILFIIGFLLLGGAGAAAIYFAASGKAFGDSKRKKLKELEATYEESKRMLRGSYGYSTEAYSKRLAELTAGYEAEVEAVKNMPSSSNKGRITFWFMSVLAALSLAFVIAVPGSFHQVEAGTVAVVKQLGQIESVRTPGTHFDFYMTKSYEVYDATVQQVEINTAAYSKDGQTMELEVYLQYQIQLDKLVMRNEQGEILQTEGIAGKYVTLSSLQARIETVTIEKTKAVMSSAEAMVIIQNRSRYSDDVSTTVRQAIGSDYYVNVQDVVLTNIDFTDEFEKAVEDKVIAEQEKQASITRAEAELEVAKLEAQRKIEEAKGNAEAQKILAQASAEAATYKIIELARVIGYTVNETYLYSVDGVETEFNVKQAESETVLYLGTKYVIDITSGPGVDKFKTLVEDYLQYLAYLEEWNGELPDVVAGDDALSIIVPGNN